MKEIDKACIHLCEVLDQLYNGYAEEESNTMRTQYNYDASAVWFLKEKGYVDILKGEWPKTKFISFIFTDKYLKREEK